MNEQITLGVIGGTGLSKLPGLEKIEDITILTPFGSTSSPISTGMIAGSRVAFLSRHGEGHILLPTEINYRANIYALKMLGVEQIISISACGSLREDFFPGCMVIPTQLIDHTRKRVSTFFGEGMVAHVNVDEPFCTRLSGQLDEAVKATGASVFNIANAITIEGPRFSTRSETNVFRGWGMDVIGMTTSPEAFLAREAEICYSTLYHVTDYDVWRTSEESVSVSQITKVIKHNIEIINQTITNLIPMISTTRACKCSTALSNAFATNRNYIPAETVAKLGCITAKYFQQSDESV